MSWNGLGLAAVVSEKVHATNESFEEDDEEVAPVGQVDREEFLTKKTNHFLSVNSF